MKLFLETFEDHLALPASDAAWPDYTHTILNSPLDILDSNLYYVIVGPK